MTRRGWAAVGSTAVTLCCVLLMAPAMAASRHAAAPLSAPAVGSPVGGEWSEESVLPVHGALGAVSCASPTFCMAVDNYRNAFLYDGTSWSQPEPFDARADEPVLGVSCVSNTFCMAVDGSGNALIFDGTDWSAPDAVDSGAFLEGVSCATSDLCVAFDSNRAFVYNGSWGGAVTLTSTSGTDDLDSVSCDPSSCIVAGSSGDIFLYDASSGTWSGSETAEPDIEIVRVSCAPSATVFCMATDSTGDVLTYDGESWSSPSATTTGILAAGVSCASSSLCLVTDGDKASVFNGSGWGSEKDVIDFGGLSCAGTICVGTDFGGDAVLYSNATWGKATAIDATGPITSASCPVGGMCGLVEPGGEVATLHDTTWNTPVAVAPQDNAEMFVSCTSATFCEAVDTAGNAYTSNGTIWSTGVLVDDPSSFGQLDAISCASPTFCIAVDSKGYFIRFNGSTWSVPSPVVSGPIASISCVSTTYCVALGGNGALVFDGASWSSPIPWNGGGLDSISCASTSFCDAVGGGGVAVEFSGTSWGASLTVNKNVALTSVSCPAADYCITAGGIWVYAFDGSTWGPALELEGYGTLETLSCATPLFCVAGDSAGNSFVYIKTGTTLSATATSPVVGQPITVDVQVVSPFAGDGAATPTGSVYVGGGVHDCYAPLSGANGVATGSCTITQPTAGPLTLWGSYEGDSELPGQVSPALTMDVGPEPSTTHLGLSAGIEVFGHEQNEHLRVTVDPKYPAAVSGSVAVTSGSSRLCKLSLTGDDGSCTLSPKALGPGRHEIEATYGGMTTITSSVSAEETLSVMREPSHTSLQLSEATVARHHEAKERFTVTVRPRYAGVPTGRVLVVSGRRTLCTVTLSAGAGSCSLPADELPKGSYILVARFPGDGDFVASSSSGHKLTIIG